MTESSAEAASGKAITEHEERHTAHPFSLTILGAGSATPTLGRHPTSQLLTINNEHFLIDCGEGTQLRLLEQKVRSGRLHHIFISHLHGDHYFGLPALLSSLNLSGRTEEMYLFGPQGLDEILTTIFRYSDTRLGYPLHFQAVDPTQPSVLVDHPTVTIESIPLEHRIACSGYLFREKPHKRKLLREKLPEDVPVHFLRALKNGEDILDEQGNLLYSVAEYTTPGPRARSYAFCSDTRYREVLVDQLKHVDMLYHEATFLNDNQLRAQEVYHSTAQQAATIAHKAQVGKLLIGHFSSRYKQFDNFVNEARTVFPNTFEAKEGVTFDIKA